MVKLPKIDFESLLKRLAKSPKYIFVVFPIASFREITETIVAFTVIRV